MARRLHNDQEATVFLANGQFFSRSSVLQQTCFRLRPMLVLDTKTIALNKGSLSIMIWVKYNIIYKFSKKFRPEVLDWPVVGYKIQMGPWNNWYSGTFYKKYLRKTMNWWYMNDGFRNCGSETVSEGYIRSISEIYRKYMRNCVRVTVSGQRYIRGWRRCSTFPTVHCFAPEPPWSSSPTRGNYPVKLFPLTPPISGGNPKNRYRF